MAEMNEQSECHENLLLSVPMNLALLAKFQQPKKPAELTLRRIDWYAMTR